MLNACLLGCGGSIPLPERPLTALSLTTCGRSVLIDCGEGTQVQLRAHRRSLYDIETICLTHYHADHVAGLPGLLLSMGMCGRSEPVTLIGPEGLERTVAGLRVVAPELPFPLRLFTLKGEREEVDMEGYRIGAFAVNHRVPCYGYTLTIPRRGRFDEERARRLGIPLPYWRRLQQGENVEGFAPEDVLGPPRKGIKVCYCTDTRPCQAIVEQGKGADLMVLEGLYGAEDRAASAAQKMHMTMSEAVDLAAQAQPSMLWLTHFSVAMRDPAQYLPGLRKIFPHTMAGETGMEVHFTFQDDQSPGRQ
ncbi:MAG: ribonuclease Z [Candidatus Excrementavichristensenella sp.]